MPDTVSINNELYRMQASDLPCLVTYGEKMGGSHLSIVLLADLFFQGYKVLLLTAYQAGKEKFLEQTGDDYVDIKFLNNKEDFQDAGQFRAIVLDSGNESLLFDAIELLPDFNERIILIKNIEKFSEALFDAIIDFGKVILSGNLDECVAKEKISQKYFSTIIAFNQPVTPLSIQIPELEKWTGYFWSGDRTGIITVPKETEV